MPPSYPEEITGLIHHLRRLPGVGPRGAERMALWLVASPPRVAEEIGAALAELRRRVRACPTCGFFENRGACPLCADPQRDPTRLCVVEHAPDILPLEKTGAYAGLYHVLGGRLSPLDHIGPEDLAIPALLARQQATPFAEIILALGSDVEGEATANYLAGLLVPGPTTPSSPRLTRLAQGLPAGGGLETADPLTLLRALAGRTPFA